MLLQDNKMISESAERDKWIEFSEGYDEKVFSLTKFPKRRDQILRFVHNGRVLNLGAGPLNYLNRDLIKEGSYVVVSDFCQAMLEHARKELQHSRLEHVVADSKHLPFADESFNTIISVNSILPQTRQEVDLMVKEIYRTLKTRSHFIAFLCAYDSAKQTIKTLGLKEEVDDEQERVVCYTTGWQCFHTPQSITRMMRKAGFSDYNFAKIFLDTPEEIAELDKLYGIRNAQSLVFEYLLVGRKD